MPRPDSVGALSSVVGGLDGFVPEVELFEEVGAVFGGAATPGAAATEGLLDFLKFFEEARRLVGEAPRAVGFPFFDFVASEGGRVILGFVMEEKLREAVIEEMWVVIGEVVGAIAADGRTEEPVVIIEEPVIESALGVDGRRIIRALHFRHALDELGVGEERFEIFLDLVKGKVDFLPTGAREFGGFGGGFGRAGRDLVGAGRDGFFEDAEWSDGGAMIILELFHDGLEATLPGVALVKWLFEVEGAGGFGVSFAFQEFVEVVAEVKNEDIAVVGGGEGIGDAGMASCGRVTTGGIDEGLRVVEIDKVGDVAFIAVFIEKVEELRLLVVDEFRDGDQGADIGECVVGVFVGNIVLFRDEFEAISRTTFRRDRPVDPLRAEGASETNNVEEIPATAAVFPLPFVRVVEVAPEGMTDELIVEADGVVAHDSRVRSGDFLEEKLAELALGQAVFSG